MGRQSCASCLDWSLIGKTAEPQKGACLVALGSYSIVDNVTAKKLSLVVTSHLDGHCVQWERQKAQVAKEDCVHQHDNLRRPNTLEVKGWIAGQPNVVLNFCLWLWLESYVWVEPLRSESMMEKQGEKV